MTQFNVNLVTNGSSQGNNQNNGNNTTHNYIGNNHHNTHNNLNTFSPHIQYQPLSNILISKRIGPASTA